MVQSSFTGPGRHARTSDDFTPPKFGGSVAVMFAQTTFADNGVSKNLFTLPQGAVIVDVHVNVTENNNDSTSAVLDVGTASDPDAYVDAVDISSVAFVRTGDTNMPGAELHQAALEEEVLVKALVTLGTGDATTGIAEVAIHYILRE
jgi:hypothetical protein